MTIGDVRFTRDGWDVTPKEKLPALLAKERKAAERDEEKALEKAQKKDGEAERKTRLERLSKKSYRATTPLRKRKRGASDFTW